MRILLSVSCGLLLPAFVLTSCNVSRQASRFYLKNGYTPLVESNELEAWNYLPGHQGHWVASAGVISYDGKSAESDRSLWTKKKYRDFIFVADVKLTRKPEMTMLPVILPSGDQALNSDGTKKESEVPYAGDTGIYLRGNSKSQVNIGYRNIGSGEIYGYRVDTTMPPRVRAEVTPRKKADKAPGQWNRFVITMKGERVTVNVNGVDVVHNALLPGIPAEGAIALQDDHASGNTFQFANVFIKEL